MGASRNKSGPPSWFIFLLGVALVFGGYYLWTNFRQFVISGAVSVAEATEQFQEQSTATAERQIILETSLPTRRPTVTPKPPCQDFEVTAQSAIMRQDASTNSPLLDTLPQGNVVCVLGAREGADGFTWYLIDQEPQTRRVETGYMREDVIRALNPTPTPSDTPLPLPSITPTPTPTLTPTLPPEQRPTLAPSVTPSISPTPTPTATPDAVSI